jgi:hypothetical protein
MAIWVYVVRVSSVFQKSEEKQQAFQATKPPLFSSTKQHTFLLRKMLRGCGCEGNQVSYLLYTCVGIIGLDFDCLMENLYWVKVIHF